MSDEQFTEAKQRYERLQSAHRVWKPRLEQLRNRLRNGRADEVHRAETELRAMRDPLAIPALEEVFALDSEPMSRRAVQVLATMPHQLATVSLARHAVWVPWVSVREQAIEELRSREQQHHVPLLIEHLRPSSSWQVWLNGGSDRAVISQDFETNYVTLFTGTQRPLDRSRLEHLPRNQANQQRVDNALAALKQLTGQDFGENQAAWRDWWAKANHVFFQMAGNYEPPRRTVVRRVQRTDSIYLTIPRYRPWGGGFSCFVPGTPVWTKDGVVAIDHIQLGDLVLSLDVETGRLDYKPVVYRTVRPRTTITNLEIDGETIGATLGHPIWVSGKGWVKVHDLDAGVSLRTEQGEVAITGLSEGSADIAFNLEVADFATYFVGRSKILVHDNTPILD
jgi:hypothetical protein